MHSMDTAFRFRLWFGRLMRTHTGRRRPTRSRRRRQNIQVTVNSSLNKNKSKYNGLWVPVCVHSIAWIFYCYYIVLYGFHERARPDSFIDDYYVQIEICSRGTIFRQNKWQTFVTTLIAWRDKKKMGKILTRSSVDFYRTQKSSLESFVVERMTCILRSRHNRIYVNRATQWAWRQSLSQDECDFLFRFISKKKTKSSRLLKRAQAYDMNDVAAVAAILAKQWPQKVELNIEFAIS